MGAVHRCIYTAPVLVTVLLALSAPLAAQTAPPNPQSDAPQADEALTRLVSLVSEAHRRAEEAVAQARARMGAAAQQAQRTRLSVLLTGDIEGELADPNCREDPPVEDATLHYARQVAYIETLEQLYAARPDTPRPVLLTIGDNVFPAPLSRFLMSRDGPGGRNLFSLISSIPYDLYTLGNLDLSAPREGLFPFVEAAREARMPLGAANVVCTPEGGAEVLCEAAGTAPGATPYTVVERGGIKIGLIGVLDPRTRSKLSETSRRGLDILEPAEILRREIPRMREQGVDLVFVTHHLAGAPVEQPHQLAAEVPGIDLLFTNYLFETTMLPDGQLQAERGYIVATRSGARVIDGAARHKAVVHVDLELVRATDRWRVADLEARTVGTTDFDPHPQTASVLRELVDAYCADWGKPIGRAPLAQPFEADDFKRFALNVMRVMTRSEIALVNARAFRSLERFPVSGQLTRADVYATLPFSNAMVRAYISGEKLLALQPLVASGALVAAGLVVSDSVLYVNGRAVKPERTYPVVLNAFLATGGDELLDPAVLKDAEVFEPSWHPDPPSIAQAIIEFVEREMYAGPGEIDDALSPDGNFPDLHRKFLWLFNGAIDTSYTSVAVQNPSLGEGAAYEQSQLNVAATDQVMLEGKAAAIGESRNHGVENTLLTQYATTRINGEDTEFEETKDLVRFNSIYKWLYPRAELGGLGGRWWAPIPFLEGEVETEFDRPEERDWHRFQMTGIVGSLFRLIDPLELKLGVNVRRDVLRPDARTTYGLVAGYDLKRTDLVQIVGRPVQFESKIEYFFNDIAASNIHEIRNQNRLYFAMFDQLFFTASFSVFAYRTADVGEFGINREFRVGLNYLWQASRQNF